jgi:hypothetical protein
VLSRRPPPAPLPDKAKRGGILQHAAQEPGAVGDALALRLFDVEEIAGSIDQVGVPPREFLRGFAVQPAIVQGLQGILVCFPVVWFCGWF